MNHKLSRRHFIQLTGGSIAAGSLLSIQSAWAQEQLNNDPVRLFLGSHMDYLVRLTDDYAALYGIEPTVETITTADLPVRLNSTFAARRSPGDVTFLTSAITAGLAEKGWLEDLSDFIDSTLLPAGLLRNALTAANYLGGTYAVPITIGAPIMHWNAELFTQHGLDPEAPKTWHSTPNSWDTMVEYAEEMTNADENIYGIVDAWAGTHSIYTFGALLQMHGGRFLDDNLDPVMNGEAGEAALNKMVELLHVKKVIDPATVTYTWVFDAAPSYLAGNRAIFFTWPFIAGVANSSEDSQIQGNSMFAPNPAVDTSASVDGSEYLGVPVFASNPEGALQFIELATSFEHQVLQGAESPWAPVLEPALNHPDVIENLIVAPAIRQSYEYPVDGGFSPDRERWVEILTSEIALALNRTKTPKAALDDAVNLINQSRS